MNEYPYPVHQANAYQVVNQYIDAKEATVSRLLVYLNYPFKLIVSH